MVEKLVMTSGPGKLKSIMSGQAQTLEKILSTMNLESLRAAFKAAGQLQEGNLEKLWSEMNLLILQHQLAETLDFVGLCESLCDRDFLLQGLRAGEASLISPHIPSIISFALQLDLTNPKQDEGMRSA
jgi:hypothetical protein